MGVLSEFKAFAVKGNVVDMAVGIIIGAAFGKIVSSFVGDVVMPPLGLLIGGVDFSDLAVVLKPAAGDVPAVVLAYGKFIQTVIDFVIVAFAIFMGVKPSTASSARRPWPQRTASTDPTGNPPDRDSRPPQAPAAEISGKLRAASDKKSRTAVADKARPGFFLQLAACLLPVVLDGHLAGAFAQAQLQVSGLQHLARLIDHLRVAAEHHPRMLRRQLKPGRLL